MKLNAANINIAAIVQARMSSTRLPGKVVEKILGKNMLVRLIERLKPLFGKENIIIATTDKLCDSVIVEQAGDMNIKVFRGKDEENVLKRYIEAAEMYGVEIIVRITADNPLVDILHTEMILNELIYNNFDYVACKGLPLGTGSEVVQFNTLKKVAMLTNDPNHLEHVTSFIYTNPAEFRLYFIKPLDSRYNRPEIRLTVDTKEDMELIREIYKRLGDSPCLLEIIKLLDTEPELMKINLHIQQKTIF